MMLYPAIINIATTSSGVIIPMTEIILSKSINKVKKATTIKIIAPTCGLRPKPSLKVAPLPAIITIASPYKKKASMISTSFPSLSPKSVFKGTTWDLACVA